MSLIEPKYKCDKCGVVQEAEWTGLPDWDVPKGWMEQFISGIQEEKHFCPECFVKLQCTECGKKYNRTKPWDPTKHYPCRRCRKYTKWVKSS